MPHIIAAVYVAYTGTAVWGMTATAMYVMAAIEIVMLASSYIMYQNAKGKMGLDDFSSGGYLDNTQSPEECLPVLYGRHRIGGNRVYVTSVANQGHINPDFLHIILTLSEGPIEGIEEIYLDDKPISHYTHPRDQYIPLAVTQFFNGSGDQGVCTYLQQQVGEWNDTLRYTAYLYIQLEFASERFNGVPKITVVAKGRQLFDPRNGATAYSNNPALVWYDFLTNKRYGLGVDASQVDTQSVIDAANWCDTQPNPYTFNGIISSRQAFLDNLTEILKNFRADTIWSEGKYKLLVRKYDTPVMSFNEDEIVEDSFNFVVPGLADTPNRIKVKYADEAGISPGDLGWIPRDQVIEDTNSVLQYDLEERDTELILNGTTNATQANLLGIYVIERSRLNKAFTFAVHPRAIALEPGDMIQVTHPLPGWTNKVVRVMDMRLVQDGLVALTTQEEDPALYDNALNLSPHTYFSTNLPDPLLPAPEATGVSFIEEEYFNKDTSYTRLVVTFTPPVSSFWEYSEAWVNVDGAGYSHYTDARGSFAIEPVKEGVNYKVKLVSVTLQGVRTTDFAGLTEWSYGVVGKNTPPADVANFRAIPQSDAIILMWDAINAIDLQGYEIRRGTNWSGGIFMGFTRAVSFHLSGAAPGSHSFMIKSIDTNGKYSPNFALASTTVYGPASYTEKMSEYNDFSEPPVWMATNSYSIGNRVLPSTPNGFYYRCTTAGGSGVSQPAWPTTNGATITDGSVVWTAYGHHVFTNTEAYVDPQVGIELRVNHAGGLTGTYLSPVYDRGSSTTRRSWLIYDYLFEGTGSTWADQFTSNQLWTDRFVVNDTWLTLFGAYSAGTLKLELGVSLNGITWTWLANFESFTVETQARFVRYKATITDLEQSGYLHLRPTTFKEAYWV